MYINMFENTLQDGVFAATASSVIDGRTGGCEFLCSVFFVEAFYKEDAK